LGANYQRVYTKLEKSTKTPDYTGEKTVGRLNTGLSGKIGPSMGNANIWESKSVTVQLLRCENIMKAGWNVKY
jgi:hypothetical protein